MTARSKPFIRYFDTGPIPVYLGFTTDEAAYQREMKRLAIKAPPPFVSDRADGTTHILTKDGALTLIVCVRIKKGVTRDQIIGLLVHEAVHCFQEAARAMREDEPSCEFEAYSIQTFARWFIEELPPLRRRA